MEIRLKYLEWSIEFKDIDATRDLFNQLKDLEPESCKLYLAMIAIEREVPNYELDTIRKLYDDACNLFGRSNVGKDKSIYFLIKTHQMVYFRVSQK